jgi:hypothetical protein
MKGMAVTAPPGAGLAAARRIPFVLLTVLSPTRVLAAALSWIIKREQ